MIGLPYDSFIVGHRTDTVNTLRLWAARATRDFDLQFFNEGDYRRAVEEKIDTENISKVLYPNDQSDEGKELRLKQQYFFVACSIADIVRRLQAAAHRRSTLPRQGRDPAQRHAPVDRGRRADARAGRRGGARLGRAPGRSRERDVRLHQPHAAARGARALAGGAVRAPAAAPPADHLRDQPALPAAGAARAGPATCDRLRAHVDHRGGRRDSRCAWRTWRPSARTASTASPRCTPSWSRRELLPDFYELWPERFNNKTNGVTPRRWLLHANPRLTRADHQRASAPSWIDRRAVAPDAAARVRRRRATSSTRSARGQAGTTSATLAALVRAAHRRRAAARRDVRRRRSSASTSTSGSCSPACRSSRTTWRSSATPAPTTCRAPTSSRARPRPATRWPSCTSGCINDVAAVINGDPAVRGRLAVAFVPELRRLAGAGDHPGGRPLGADLDGRQGGVGHQQHEVRAERRADHRHARRRQRRDPRRGRARELLPVRPDTPTRWRALRARGYDPRDVHRAQPRAGGGAGADRSRASSAWAIAIATGRSSTTCATTIRTWSAPTSTPTSPPRRAPPPPTATARDWSRCALLNIVGAQPLLQRRDHPPVRHGDLGPRIGPHQPRAARATALVAPRRGSTQRCAMRVPGPPAGRAGGGRIVGLRAAGAHVDDLLGAVRLDDLDRGDEPRLALEDPESRSAGTRGDRGPRPGPRRSRPSGRSRGPGGGPTTPRTGRPASAT